MKDGFTESLKLILEFVGVVMIIILTIGFFNTPFQNGNAIKIDDTSVAERNYIEFMTPEIQNFTKITLEIKDTNDLANKGKIVPLKVSQIYSDDFDKISNDYNQLSAKEVPERFKQFHVIYLKALEYQGASLNETLTYLKDKEPSHLDAVSKYNDNLIKQYNDSINLFNRLVEEKKVK